MLTIKSGSRSFELKNISKELVMNEKDMTEKLLTPLNMLGTCLMVAKLRLQSLILKK